MRWYKILARILLMLSVIDFAIAAPVIVQEHDVRVSMVDVAKDETATSPLRRDPSDMWLANTVGRTDAPQISRSSDSGHRWEQEPRQYNPMPRMIESNDSPEPSNPTPPIDPYTKNPLSQSPAPPGPGSTSPSPTSHSSVVTTPTHDPPPPDGSPQIASSPDRSPSSNSWLPAETHSGSTSSSSGSAWELLTSSDKNNPTSPDQSSTGESHPPNPGQIDHRPPPPPPSEPGPSTRPRLPGPRGAVSSDVKNAAMTLMAMSWLKPRTYGSGAVGAATLGGLDKFLNVPTTSTSSGVPVRGLSANPQNQKKSVSRGLANLRDEDF